MPWTEAFDLADADHKNKVMAATWGHLAAEKDKTYPGYILFVHAGYGGDMVILKSNFKGLEDSPWLFEAMMEKVSDYIMHHKNTEGNIYRFDGDIKNYKFTGKIKKCKVV